MFPNDSDYDAKVTLETDISGLAVEDQPFRILFLGNWSGREENSENPVLSEISLFEIDKDNFDEVFKKLDVKLNLNFAGGDADGVLSLSFNNLDDFHPDNIFQQLRLFSNLFDLRQQLLSPKTYNFAAAEVDSWFRKTSDTVSESTQTSESVLVDEPLPDDWLNQLLSQTEQNKSLPNKAAASSELSSFIKKIVKPNLIQINAEEQSETLMVIDEVISDLMRKVLHHPEFQSLESAWRAAYFLVRRVETNSKLKIYLSDVSKSELSTDLKSLDDLDSNQLQKILTRKDSNQSDLSFWAVICGNYSFSPTVEDTATLIRISDFASVIRCPFISYIKPEMFTLVSPDESDNSLNWKISVNSLEDKLWTALRVSPGSAYLGLASTRVLGRLPYGENTEPIENFHFEEFTESFSHENYLWFNPSFIIALLLAQTYCEFDWKISQNLLRQIENMPIHSYSVNGMNTVKSCAEFELNEKNHEAILDQGLISIFSRKNMDDVHLSRLQSAAFPFSLLKGRWT